MGKRRVGRPSESRVRTLRGSVPEAELDLHGLRASAAEIRVQGFLRSWSQRGSGTVLRVITGRGNRSAEGPVLRDMVETLLKEELGRTVDDFALESGGGAFVVRLR